MLITTAASAACCLLAARRVSSVPCMGMRSDSLVARELDSVPVFGILLQQEDSFYCEDGVVMVYTQLADASRVLAKLQQTFVETELALMPLSLGHVLQQGGLLGGNAGGGSGLTSDVFSSEGDLLAAAAVATSQSAPMRINLIASPTERRLAKQLREDSAALPPIKRDGAAAELQRVPVFHIGAVPSRAAEQGEAPPPPIWPFFFRAADVDELWAQLGEGRPQSTLHATDLAELVDGLREVDSAPAKPLVCAPLDALDFCKSRDRVAVTQVEDALAEAADDA